MSDLEEERIRAVLRETVTELCRNSSSFQRQLNVQGLLAVTVDTASVVILQVNEIVEKASDGSFHITSSGLAPQQKTCECCCTCRSSEESKSLSRPPPIKNMVAPSAGPHLMRQDSSEVAPPTSNPPPIPLGIVPVQTLHDSAKRDDHRDKSRGDHSLQMVHLPMEKVPTPVDNSATGPFITGVATNSKAPKIIQVAPVTNNTSRTDFHESQLASFASLAHDINLGTAPGQEVGVAWYPPGLQLSTGVTDPTRTAPTDRTITHSHVTPAAVTSQSTTTTSSKTGSHSDSSATLHVSAEEKKAIRAEKARQYRLAMRNNPALRQKYEETKRKNRERMQRHRMMASRSSSSRSSQPSSNLCQGSLTYQVASSSAQVRPRTPSSSPEDAKIWQDIHTWQSQTLGLATGVAPLVTHALQTQQMLIPASIIEASSSTVTSTARSIPQTTVTGIK